jgi:hypothetical protein
MRTTTTLTSMTASMTASKSEPKGLCIICEAQPFDLICTCGDKFDFNCIQQHVEQINLEFQGHFDEVAGKLVKLNELKQGRNNNFDAHQAVIDNWVCMKKMNIFILNSILLET